MNDVQPVVILGAGGWGTALAAMLAGHGRAVILWARRETLAAELREQRENREYLPGVRLPGSVSVTSELPAAVAGAVAGAVTGAAWVLVTVPSVGVPDLLAALPRTLGLVLCAKGLAPDGDRLSLLAAGLGYRQVAVLSGPNLAPEVARGLPAGSVVAGPSGLTGPVQAALHTPTFRVYTSSDVAGVELGGVLKNVMALATGMCDGLGLGDNARASVITRGLREMGRYLASQGADEGTVYGLSGLGDLIATASSPLSRNRAAGEALARGQAPEQGSKVVEGVRTARLLSSWAAAQGTDLPIVQAVNGVVQGDLTPQAGLERLMGRGARTEA